MKSRGSNTCKELQQQEHLILVLQLLAGQDADLDFVRSPQVASVGTCIHSADNTRNNKFLPEGGSSHSGEKQSRGSYRTHFLTTTRHVPALRAKPTADRKPHVHLSFAAAFHAHPKTWGPSSGSARTWKEKAGTGQPVPTRGCHSRAQIKVKPERKMFAVPLAIKGRVVPATGTLHQLG
ncbi:hypothetical protein Anapl_05232 [Anas platyrhynchos]|uniref:Uncharacterized protein n=1 Tax=Anas platyrhynchos TaxID=8839 RepID=R0LH02_ANAPL|nr:hypothetical protein Anapl_05232 [Anas platyrhynchos]